MDQLLFGFDIVPNIGMVGSFESFIRFFVLTLIGHKESILKEDIKPFIERNSMVVGRDNVVQRFFGRFTCMIVSVQSRFKNI